jgi:hypothetical protein
LDDVSLGFIDIAIIAFVLYYIQVKKKRNEISGGYHFW